MLVLLLAGCSGAPEVTAIQRDEASHLREIHPVSLADATGEGGASAGFGFRHQVSRADPQPVVAFYDATLQPVADGWTITRIVPAEASEAAPLLWDLGPVTVTPSWPART